MKSLFLHVSKFVSALRSNRNEHLTRDRRYVGILVTVTDSLNYMTLHGFYFINYWGSKTFPWSFANPGRSNMFVTRLILTVVRRVFLPPASKISQYNQKNNYFKLHIQFYIKVLVKLCLLKIVRNWQLNLNRKTNS